MKDNALEEEAYQMKKMRGLVDPVEEAEREFKRKLAIEFLGSSEVTKAILEKKGLLFFGEAKPISYFENKLRLGELALKKGHDTRSDEKPPCYGHYFDKPPIIDRNLELGCLKEGKKSRYVHCKYWTLKDDGCPIVSIKK
jgi:hypothetical protein